MSDRYTRRPSDGEWVCATCGSLVGNRLAHGLFHARIDLMYDAIPVSGESIAATDWQAAHDAGEDEEMRVPECPFPTGARVRDIRDGNEMTVTGWTADEDGTWVVEGKNGGPWTLWRRPEYLELVPDEPEPHLPNEDDVRKNEPPVGAVARCSGCGSIYVHRPDGWLATDGPFLDSWGNLARSFCGPVKVIYNPEEDK